MKEILDTELRGRALLFEGPLDLLHHARKANSGPNPFYHPEPQRWPGRVGRTWDEFYHFLETPWNEAVEKIESIVRVVRKYVPAPKSVRRKVKWDDLEGEVDVDRAMHGDPDYFRRAKRTRMTASRNVALVANLENTRYGATVNPSGLWFRSGVAIAVADMLEDAGYSCEVWVWNRGAKLFPPPNHYQFTAWKAKAAGMPVDMHAMADSMSYWFTTQAVLAVPAAASCGVQTTADAPKGLAIHPTVGATKVEDSGIGGWIKHLDIEEGTQKVAVPMVYSWSWDDPDSMPVQTAKAVLSEIVQADED